MNANIRTRACRHILEKGVCLMQTCTFAHSLNELVPLICFYDWRCRNERCTRFHPSKGETMEQYAYANGIRFPERYVDQQPPAVVPHFDNVRTKPCRHVMEHGVCLHDGCTFAHSLEELNPIPCVHDGACRNERCTRFHPSKGQTIEQYILVNNF